MQARPAPSLGDYLQLARPEHWIKHAFIVPGIVMAAVLHGVELAPRLGRVALGLVAAALVASANYVLNDWLDARYDAHHPTKGRRPAVSKDLSAAVVWGEYAGLALLGLAAGLGVSTLFIITLGIFLASGITYNVAPLRTKERPYLDVPCEAINNPIRLTLGWAMVDGSTLPPSSVLAAFWMGGAFLMALKRLAEYRSASAQGILGQLELYRSSFRRYTESTLLVSAFLYAQMAAFFVAIFLIKYRVEYLLTLPVFAALFGSYLHLALEPESAAQEPERLIRDRALMVIIAILVGALIVLTWVDIPVLDRLSEPHYIQLPFGSSR